MEDFWRAALCHALRSKLAFGGVADYESRCTRLLPALLSLVRHRAPSQRHGLLTPEVLHYGRPTKSSANAKLSSARLSNGIPNASSGRIPDQRHGLTPC